MSANEILGALALLLGLVRFFTYLRSMARGQSKPHVFTWLTWAILNTIVFLGLHVEGAGPGAWGTGLAALFCFLIAALALRYGEKHITRSDWVSFILAMGAIPIWLASTTVAAMVWIVIIEIAGYYPMYRKSWHRPYEESLFSFSFSVARLGLSMLALDAYTLATTLWMGVILALEGGFIVYALIRRRYVPKPT